MSEQAKEQNAPKPESSKPATPQTNARPSKRVLRLRVNRKAAIFTGVAMALWYAWPAVRAHAEDTAAQSGQAWYSWLLAAFYGAFVKTWHWILGILLALVDKALGSALDNIPQSWRSISFQPLINFLGLVNYYFPLDTMMGALGAYFIWYGLLLLYRIIKSWIPTVSG